MKPNSRNHASGLLCACRFAANDAVEAELDGARQWLPLSRRTGRLAIAAAVVAAGLKGEVRTDDSSFVIGADWRVC